MHSAGAGPQGGGEAAIPGGAQEGGGEGLARLWVLGTVRQSWRCALAWVCLRCPQGGGALQWSRGACPGQAWGWHLTAVLSPLQSDAFESWPHS